MVLGFPIFMTAPSAYPQSHVGADTGIVTGTIVDPTGAGIQKATVSIRNDRVSYLTVKSDNEGHFVIEAAPGVYTLRASGEAFGASEKTVTLTSGTPTVEQITLYLAESCPCGSISPTTPLEVLTSSLELLLPLNPLPPYQLSAKTLKHLQK